MKKNKLLSGLFKIAVAVAVLVGIGMVMSKFLSNPIKPVISQQMYDTLTAQGYAPQNMTDKAANSLKNSGLSDCIIGEKNGIRVEFYNFDNDDAAQQVYHSSVSKIHSERERRDRSTHDYSEGASNHWRYTVIGNSLYSTAIYVGNTAIYAYGGRENASEINALLKSIGYTEIEGSGQANPEYGSLFRLAFTVLWFLIVLLSRYWLWPVVYRSAGVTSKNLDQFYDERLESRPKRKTASWLMEKSPRPNQTAIWLLIYRLVLLPDLIAIVLSFIGLFTRALDNFLSQYVMVVGAVTFLTGIAGIVLDKFMYRKK